MTLYVILPPSAGRTLVRSCLLVVSLVCLGIYSYAYLARTSYQAYANWKFDKMQAPVAAALVAPRDRVAPTARPSRKVGSWSRPEPSDALIGRLSVPRLHLSAMVREGTDRATLQLAVGHIPATPLPGQSGNVAVAGHRDTFFRGLKDLKTGDEIRFSTAGGEFRYDVESLVVVGPDDVGVLGPSAEKILTLVTCYPFSYIGAAPRRFVVRARQRLPQTPVGSVVE